MDKIETQEFYELKAKLEPHGLTAVAPCLFCCAIISTSLKLSPEPVEGRSASNH